MPLTLSTEDLQAILGQVESSLDAVLKSEASSSSSMSKDEESGKSPDVSASPAETSSPGGEGSPGGEPPMDGAPPAGDGAPPMDPAAGASPAASPAAAPAPAPAAPGGAPMEETLESKLAAMPPDQLRHLYMAAKAALFQQMGSGQDPAAAAGAPPAASPGASPGAAPGAPPPGAAPMAMAEGDPDHLASDGKAAVAKPSLKQDVFAAAKAEGDPDKLASDGKVKAPGASLKQDVFAAAKKSEDEIADLKAQVAGLTKAVTMVLGQPLRKAVTAISQVQKPAEGIDMSGLNKAEITAKLKDLDYSKLQKRERDAINGWFDGRNGPEKFAHLFTK